MLLSKFSPQELVSEGIFKEAGLIVDTLELHANVSFEDLYNYYKLVSQRVKASEYVVALFSELEQALGLKLPSSSSKTLSKVLWLREALEKKEKEDNSPPK